MQTGVIASGFDPVHVSRLDEDDPAVLGNRHAVDIRLLTPHRLKQLSQDFTVERSGKALASDSVPRSRRAFPKGFST